MSGQRFPWGNTISQNLANYFGETGNYDQGPDGLNAIGSVGGTSPATSPVGSFAANGYGLYDMAGNLLEWCWDWYGSPYAGGTDPHGATSGSFRVLRGGNWNYVANRARCASRSATYPDYALSRYGFRSVLAPGQ
jgi:formylglycine-generating enzyme required for sulfatase activity